MGGRILIVLGHDPGTSNPGLAVVQRLAKGWGVLYSPVLTNYDSYLNELAHIFHMYDVNCASVENIDWVRWKKKNQVSGSRGMARSVGALESFAAIKRIACVSIATRTTAKSITGSGRATSEQIRSALERVWIKEGWPGAISTHRSDAIAIAIAGAIKDGSSKL